MNRPKGTKDIFGRESDVRAYVLDVLRAIAQVHCFTYIETPIFEQADVFVRAVGETSDIVNKEMYAFNDRSGRPLILRPEGTAGVVRAIVENKLYTSLPIKLFYEGPMFRYENPQKGRQRQFTQFGVEMIGERSPYADLEVIMMAAMILDELRIPYLLKVNSLGDAATRTKYALALQKHLTPSRHLLTPLSQTRLEKNPLRILDDKVDGASEIVRKAPKMSNFYTPETKEYFAVVTNFLRRAQVPFEVDEKLVRGLDYYTDTAFEFVSVSGSAGSQSTLIGGGRYQNLIHDFGGPDLSGVGFGLGLERITNEIAPQLTDDEITSQPHVFVMNIAPTYQAEVLQLVNLLRRHGFITAWNVEALKIQKAFAKAEASNALAYIIAGEKELATGKVSIKVNGDQFTVPLTDVINVLDEQLEALTPGGKDEKN